MHRSLSGILGIFLLSYAVPACSQGIPARTEFDTLSAETLASLFETRETLSGEEESALARNLRRILRSDDPRGDRLAGLLVGIMERTQDPEIFVGATQLVYALADARPGWEDRTSGILRHYLEEVESQKWHLIVGTLPEAPRQAQDTAIELLSMQLKGASDRDRQRWLVDGLARLGESGIAALDQLIDGKELGPGVVAMINFRLGRG
jgi:hypothetical protein